ncbi:hypothetical protein, conserved [Plasmodium gonderi]|uniref:Uncharacterized protein n=1 Tax=Plasmodium gonderi TaxID=77519 RepID=A0A1Y1JH62_PLAGO|nr:hypothetical protein, conserved [Plasmodium gonderi]GAW80675.1 hypothetical protein, conserved [Plasmodium gonderi]
MYCLLKNALNFDNFKNIKIDLINKVKTSDATDSHEENEVFNFLKDKDFFSENLKLSRQWNLECTSSVQKKLKHINNLKRHLNSITNFRRVEKSGLNKDLYRIKTAHGKTEEVSSFLKNGHTDDYDSKNMEIFNNYSVLDGDIRRGVHKNEFRKILSKRIQKNKFIGNNFFKRLIYKYISQLNNNNSKNYIEIGKFEPMNDKIIAYLHCYKKCIIEKGNPTKNLRVSLKKRIYYKSIITKKKVSSIRSKRMRMYLRRQISERCCDNRNQVKSSLNDEVHIADKKLYIKLKKGRKKNINSDNSSSNEFHKKTKGNTIMGSINRCGEESTSETVNNLIEDGCRNSFKFGKRNNLGNGKITGSKKNMEVFKNNNLENVHKNSSNLKNIKLSILRRVSTNNQYENKKEFKRNRDPRFHFLSNNVNFYETVINNEKCKEENVKKGECFSNQNIIQNGEMSEIKQKIKTALISLNNIKKNNYKLKFCLEKEIIDNTIHQNELKRSLCSIFSENSLQRKNTTVKQQNFSGGQIKNKDVLRNNRHNADKHDMQKVKTIREEKTQNKESTCEQNNFSNNIMNVSFDKKVTLEKTRCKGGNNVSYEENENIRFQLSEEFVKSAHNVVTDNRYKSKSKLINEKEEKRSYFNESRDNEMVTKSYTYRKKEQNLKKVDINVQKHTFTLNREISNEYICRKKSLKDKDKNDIINNIKKMYNWETVMQEKSNTLKNNEKEMIHGIGGRSRSNYLSSLKNKTEKEAKGALGNVEKVKIKEVIRKHECNKNEWKYKNISGVSMSNEQFKDNKGYTKRDKSNDANKKCQVGDFNGPLGGNRKTDNGVVNSNVYMNKSTGSRELVLDKTDRERTEFDLNNVRNIKNIISCGIYVNKEVERINKRNKNAICIIEKYLDNVNRTSLNFSKEKEKKIYLPKSCTLKNEYNKKQAKTLPGLYDHYAFLLLNFRGYKVV